MDEPDEQPQFGPENTPRDRRGRPLYRGMPVLRQIVDPFIFPTAPQGQPSIVFPSDPPDGDYFLRRPNYSDMWHDEGVGNLHNSGQHMVGIGPRYNPLFLEQIYTNMLNASPAYEAVPPIENAYVQSRQDRREVLGRLRFQHPGPNANPALPDDVVRSIMRHAGVGPTQREHATYTAWHELTDQGLPPEVVIRVLKQAGMWYR